MEDRTIDLITCAQAFHWFDRVQTRLEFSRILKSDGWTVLIWNERRDDASPINAAYDNLLKAMAPDYQNVAIVASLQRIFGRSLLPVRVNSGLLQITKSSIWTASSAG